MVLCTGLLRAAAGAELNFKTGFNLFSVTQDVQLGEENVAQIEKQVTILHDDNATLYVNELGKRLCAFAPNNQPEYVWQFKVVNSADVNAFALPGGYIYVNRATIESAADEAELAGVLAHEEAHVVMRHGTHQATETMLAQAPAEWLASLLGQEGSLLSKLGQLAIGMGTQSLLLRNSREMEAEADSVGTYILYQAGYDPHGMAQFFALIQQKYPQPTGVIAKFLADHPDPGNRVTAVDDEIPELGPSKSWVTDSPRFQSVKSHLLSLPSAPKPETTDQE